MTLPTAFVAGATGYTGQNVVAECRRRGLPTVAHVRPDSGRLADWTARFAALGATVDSSPWTAEGMAEAMARHRPGLVFSLLGTTQARGRQDGVSTYEAVDYGLSVLLLVAAGTVEPPPVFVYLSSLGAGGRAPGAYLKARTRVEAEVAASGIPAVVARPSTITGPDREEDRPAERLAASVGDALLGALAGLGAKTLRARWGSMTGEVLARALVSLALDPGKRGVFEAEALHAAAGD